MNAGVGFPLISGPEGHEGPVNQVIPAWDIATGMMAATGILAAERHRRLTGEGRLIRLPLQDVALATAGNLGYLAEAEVNGDERARYGNHNRSEEHQSELQSLMRISYAVFGLKKKKKI